MPSTILVVDDESRYRHLVRVNLEAGGYQVITASDGKEAVDSVSADNPDLVVMDILMPNMDGFAACERIRQFSNVPIIMLTARGEEQERVKGLNVGADDYVVKPFSATELVARIKAVLRRAQNADNQTINPIFTHDNLRIDFARAEVFRDDKPIFLSATEYRLLIQFAHHVGEVLSAEELLTAVWGPQYKEDKEILWVSIARMRQKLEEDAHNPRHIVTRSGLGYLMPPERKEKHA